VANGTHLESMMNNGEDDAMGRIRVDVTLANSLDVYKEREGSLTHEQVRRITIPATVDSGASYLVIPESVVSQLGLPEKGEATVTYADRRKETRKVVDQVNLEYSGRDGTFKAIVEPARTDALMGAIVLEDLDLLVDCRTQTVQPRDPRRIIAEIE
jgi:clan AA aspartic protease